MYWSSSRYKLLLVSFTNKPVCLYVGMRGIFQNGGQFGNFQMLLSTLSSYGLITGFADFFTEWCYWYLQSVLNHCPKAAPLLVENQISLIFFFFFFFHLSSLRQAIPVLSEPLELVSSQFFKAWVEDVQRKGHKKKEDIFCWWISCAWLCGLTPFIIAHVICMNTNKHGSNAASCCFRLFLCSRKEQIINVIYCQL